MAVTSSTRRSRRSSGSWLSRNAQQPDLLGARRGRRSPASTCRSRPTRFATPKNLYNITRNVTFVAIIALGMTLVIITGGIDLSVGSVLCLCAAWCSRVTMHAGYGIEVGIAAAIATALAGRRLQRHADRLSRHFRPSW